MRCAADAPQHGVLQMTQLPLHSITRHTFEPPQPPFHLPRGRTTLPQLAPLSLSLATTLGPTRPLAQPKSTIPTRFTPIRFTPSRNRAQSPSVAISPEHAILSSGPATLCPAVR